MADRLPLLSAQLAFGLEAQRSGWRAAIVLRLRTPPSCLSTADVRQVLESVLLRNPALSYRIRFSRGAPHQERHPAECDLAELHAVDEEAKSRLVVAAREQFETSLDGAPMVARLLRSPESDDLFLIFDHALVDEQSLRLIERQLAAPSSPDGRESARYEAAVNDRKAFETAAASGPGADFWADRLKAAADFPKVNQKYSRAIPFTLLPDVAILPSFHGSLFPHVLFSLHRALRDVGERGTTVIGYPWGGRNVEYSDVVGCFMNTTISLGTTGPQQAPETADDFLTRWYREIEYADVPFTAVTALGSTFPGSVTAYLSYTHAAAHTVDVAGVPAVPVGSTHIRIPPTSTFMAAATVHDGRLELRLVLDEEITGYGAEELGSHWRHRLETTVESLSERTP